MGNCLLGHSSDKFDQLCKFNVMIDSRDTRNIPPIFCQSYVAKPGQALTRHQHHGLQLFESKYSVNDPFVLCPGHSNINKTMVGS